MFHYFFISSSGIKNGNLGLKWVMYLPRDPLSLDARGKREFFLIIDAFGDSFRSKWAIIRELMNFFLSDFCQGESFLSFLETNFW